MGAAIHLTGLNRGLEPIIRNAVNQTNSRALFVGCAYVSIYGAEFLQRLVQSTQIRSISLITDVRDAVTHPSALRLALAQGWATRVVNRAAGTFHPKVIIASPAHLQSLPRGPRVIISGSNNLSRGGLLRNIEAGTCQIENLPIAAAAALATDLWGLGVPLTAALLADYETRFRERNSKRDPDDLRALGVSDESNLDAAPADRRQRQSPSISSTAAKAAWAGLESFTGDYTFQLEFPRDAGLVLARLSRAGRGGRRLNILCSDGAVRQMAFAFYAQNDMFRLNIPNDVPGVAHARATHTGLALVELNQSRVAPLRLILSSDPAFIKGVQGRSFALGTWGRTNTRFYGWY